MRTLLLSLTLLVISDAAFARERSCPTDPGSERSSSTSTSTTISILNTTPYNVSIEWVDPTGTSKDYGVMARGAQRRQETFTAHFWIARDPSGRCLSSFVSNGDEEVWIIQAPGAASTEGYAAVSVEGWQVRLSPQLGKFPEIERQMISVLRSSLRQIKDRVPPSALGRLMGVRIWLEYEDLRFPGGVYHSSREWLIKNGMNPEKERSVQFSRALIRWIVDQPMMVLHEFAHAYHHQVLSRGYLPIIRAFERATDSHQYDRVERNTGKFERAYALDNPLEFFAELTEAYFGKNDYFPFTRSDLEKFDAESFEMIRAAWSRPVEALEHGR